MENGVMMRSIRDKPSHASRTAVSKGEITLLANNSDSLADSGKTRGMRIRLTMAEIRDKSILVVDDDPSMLRALGKILSSEGAAVTCAEWAGDAIEVLTQRQNEIDLVITDLRMPFLTGITLVYAIRKTFPALPVIVLTAFGGPDLEAACLAEGAAAFLEKPVNTAQLLAAIGRVLALAAHTVKAASLLAPSPSALTIPTLSGSDAPNGLSAQNGSAEGGPQEP
jgi:CheY-like chemotaxis protein